MIVVCFIDMNTCNDYCSCFIYMNTCNDYCSMFHIYEHM